MEPRCRLLLVSTERQDRGSSQSLRGDVRRGHQQRPPACESSCLGAQMPDDTRLLFREQTNACARPACWAADSCLTEIKNVPRGTAASVEGFTFSRNGFGKVPRSCIWPSNLQPEDQNVGKLLSLSWLGRERGGHGHGAQRDPLYAPRPHSPARFGRAGLRLAHTRARGKGPLVLTVQNNSILPTSEKKKSL